MHFFRAFPTKLRLVSFGTFWNISKKCLFVGGVGSGRAEKSMMDTSLTYFSTTFYFDNFLFVSRY